jgi:WD40 repeat protein
MRIAVWVGAVAIIAGSGLMAAGRDGSPDVRVTLPDHFGGVTAIAFNAKGDEIATGAGNGTVRIWNVKSGASAVKREEFKGISITGLAFSRDGSILAASGKGKVGMWIATEIRSAKTDVGTSPMTAKGDTRNFKWIYFPSTDSEATYSDVAIPSDGQEIYFARRHFGINYPGRMFRYDKARDITEERPGPKFFDPCAMACISHRDSGVVAVYGTVGEKGMPAVVLYGFGEPKVITRGVPPLTKDTPPKDAPPKDTLSKDVPPKDSVPKDTPPKNASLKETPQRISFSTDGKWLCAYSGTLAVWPVPGSHIIGGDPAILEGVYAAAIGPDNLMATVSPPDESRNAAINIWKLEVQGMKHTVEVKKVATYPTTLKDVGCLAFSPDGKTLAVGGFTDGVVQLWNMVEK